MIKYVRSRYPTCADANVKYLEGLRDPVLVFFIMTTELQPCISVLLLSLAIVQGGNLPEFSLIADGPQSSVPNIQVVFPDGATDRLVLWDHFFNEEDRLAPKTGSSKFSKALQNLQVLIPQCI